MWKNNSLSIVMFVLFVLCLVGHSIVGWKVYNRRGANEPDDINDGTVQMVGSTGEVLEPGTGGRLRVKVRDSVWLGRGAPGAARANDVSGRHRNAAAGGSPLSGPVDRSATMAPISSCSLTLERRSQHASRR